MNKNIENIINGRMKDIAMIATRSGFGDGLLLAGKENKRVVALCADLTESIQIEKFKTAFPDRYFEMGVAEQNMASVASGMAAMGKIPFIASYAMFSPGRNWEQIRTTICYNNVPVKVVGAHAGVSVGPDGGTHQALEDIGLMRMLPNMVVVVPCDALEAKKAALEISRTENPSYLRLFREKSPVLTVDEDLFEIGKANIIYETSSTSSLSIEEGKGVRPVLKIGIIACGEMVARSLLCVKGLEDKGIELGILNLHTIKPIDVEKIKYMSSKYKNILTVEEHQVAGGMGSAILECLAENNLLGNVKVKMMGVKNRFGQSGTKEELYEEYEINEKHIFSNVLSMLEII